MIALFSCFFKFLCLGNKPLHFHNFALQFNGLNFLGAAQCFFSTEFITFFVIKIITDVIKVKIHLGVIDYAISRILLTEEITRQEVLDHNIAKLQKRYGEKYSDAAAHARADKETKTA